MILTVENIEDYLKMEETMTIENIFCEKNFFNFNKIELLYKNTKNIYVGIAYLYLLKKNNPNNKDLNRLKKDLFNSDNLIKMKDISYIYYYLKERPKCKSISKIDLSLFNFSSLEMEKLILELLDRDKDLNIIDTKDKIKNIKYILESVNKDNFKEKIPILTSKIDSIITSDRNKNLYNFSTYKKKICENKINIKESNIYLKNKKFSFFNYSFEDLSQVGMKDDFSYSIKDKNKYIVINKIFSSYENREIKFKKNIKFNKISSIDSIVTINNFIEDFFFPEFKSKNSNYKKINFIEDLFQYYKNFNGKLEINPKYNTEINQYRVKQNIKTFFSIEKEALIAIKYIILNSIIIDNERKHIFFLAYRHLLVECDLISFSRIIIPEIEELIRTYLKINKRKTWVTRGGDPFNEKGLSSLFKDNEDLFHKKLLLAFEFVLTSKDGFNLRNEISHGLFEHKKERAQELFHLFMIINIILIYPNYFFKKYNKYQNIIKKEVSIKSVPIELIL